MSWVFLLLFTMESFGGPVEVRFSYTTLDACQRMQKVVVRELAKMSMNKYELKECYAIPRP